MVDIPESNALGAFLFARQGAAPDVEDGMNVREQGAQAQAEEHTHFLWRSLLEYWVTLGVHA